MSLAMLNHSVASMAGRIPGGKFHDIKEKIWGIELTADNPESVWKPEVSTFLFLSTFLTLLALLAALISHS